MNATCATCRFYDGNECRINPPSVLMDGNGRAYALWPRVTRDAWCGLHEKLEQAHRFELGTPLTVERK
jgi:hypothetical protein